MILENKATWLEVSLTVDGELAEAVAEVLSRFALNGVVIESTDVVYGEGDIEVQAEGPMRVYGYLPLDDQLEKTRNRLEQSLWYLGRIQPLPEPEFRAVQETDWSENWKRHYRPVSIGRRLVIVPEWLESPDENRLPIRINPGMAFGTGTHPTTQLCLGVIESLLTGSKMTDGSQWTLPDLGIPVQEWDVIDVGCGSGILSIAAIKLGARHAVGVDIDPGAIATARVNAKANDVEDFLELGVGSLAELHDCVFSISKAPVVLANILAPILERLLDEGLGELVEPSGILLLSGILDEQVERVKVAIERNGLQVVLRHTMGDWAILGAQPVT